MIFHFSGSYIFIETSAPRRRGQKALLHSALFSPTGSTTKCLRFWYHMYGSQMGTMNIYLSKNGSLPGTKVWSLSGNQGNQWSSGTVAVKSNTQYSVSVIQNRSRGGLVVERQTPEREVGGSILRSLCCVLEQDTFTPPKVLVIPRKRWLRPDMNNCLLGR